MPLDPVLYRSTIQYSLELEKCGFVCFVLLMWKHQTQSSEQCINEYENTLKALFNSLFQAREGMGRCGGASGRARTWL